MDSTNTALPVEFDMLNFKSVLMADFVDHLIALCHLRSSIVAITGTDGMWTAGSPFSELFNNVISRVITTTMRASLTGR